LEGACLNRIMLGRARRSSEQALADGAEQDRSGWAGGWVAGAKGGAWVR